MEEPARLESTGSQRVGHDRAHRHGAAFTLVQTTSLFRPVKYIAGIFWFLKCGYGTSLAVQWLRLNSAAGDVSSVSGQGTKIPHALQCSQKKKSVDNISLHWVTKIKLCNADKVLSRDTVRLKVLNNCKPLVTLYSSCFIFLFQYFLSSSLRARLPLRLVARPPTGVSLGQLG